MIVHCAKSTCFIRSTYSRLPIRQTFKGNRKKFELSGVRVIGSSKKMAEGKVKNSLYCTVNILKSHLIVAMSSENLKILLDYKSERNVTNHCLNRACVSLFWEVKLLHGSMWQSISASTSKLYSYNTSIGNPKFNVSDASRRLFSRLFKGSKHGSSYRG